MNRSEICLEAAGSCRPVPPDDLRHVEARLAGPPDRQVRTFSNRLKERRFAFFGVFFTKMRTFWF